MSDRLVVCFRAPELEIEPGAYLASAHELIERAAAAGGSLVAWGVTSHAFEFSADALQDALELALSVLRGAPPGREPAMGISEGALETTGESSAGVTLAWGYALVTSTALSRAARPGELLVDPKLPAARRGELSTTGSRIAVFGSTRTRGLLVDVNHPFRRSLSETGSIVKTPFLGRADAVTIESFPGAITVVRAGRGLGGTRFLEVLEQSLEPARTLAVTPHPFGEPLGPLRRSMLRAVTMGHAPLNLSGEAGHSLDALLAGEGLDPESVSDLLIAWLTPDSSGDPSGVVILDDAGEIDADSLEAIEHALSTSRNPFRVVARLGDMDFLPPALESLVLGSELRLSPLSQEEAMELVGASLGSEPGEEIRLRWATRGGRLPLGVIESLREAVESGDLVWEEGRVSARLKSSGAGGARPPKHWVKRRLSHQHDDARRVLEAIAILGGQAESQDLSEVLRGAADLSLDLSATIAVLVAAGWVQRLKPDVIALPSASHRDAILTTLDEGAFQAWHRTAAEAFSRRDKPLFAAMATTHAALSGDAERAAELSRQASAATRAMGLERTAVAFERFAEQRDIGALAERNLFISQLEVARAVPSVWPGVTRDSLPPPGTHAHTEPPPSGVSPVAPEPAAPRGSEPPSAAVEAIRKGDPETVERMAEQAQVDEGRSGLADRLRAMAHLARGETGDAIRRLREAAETARREGSRDRCRAALALGVALAAAGRHEEALLETLDALARAREMQDAKGERACLLFLGQLATSAGQHDVAEAWSAAVES